MAIPDLPSGNRARVYALMVEIAETDPVLDAVVKTWVTGLPNARRRAPRSVATAIDVRMSPRLGPVAWYSPDSQLGNLQIEVEILVQGAVLGAADMLDVINIWEAFENAYYPVGDFIKQASIQERLVAAGSHTGLITFSQPASFTGLDAETGRPVARGMMQVDVRRLLNPNGQDQ